MIETVSNTMHYLQTVPATEVLSDGAQAISSHIRKIFELRTSKLDNPFAVEKEMRYVLREGLKIGGIVGGLISLPFVNGLNLNSGSTFLLSIIGGGLLGVALSLSSNRVSDFLVTGINNDDVLGLADFSFFQAVDEEEEDSIPEPLAWQPQVIVVQDANPGF